MTHSKKGPIRKKKSQKLVDPQVDATTNAAEAVAETNEAVEAPKEVAEAAPVAETPAKETTYIRILGFEFESAITKEEEILLNKVVESGDVSHISKQLLFKGIQELGHIIEKQRSVYDTNLTSLRNSSTELRNIISESDDKLSKMDANILQLEETVSTLGEEKESLEKMVKEKATWLETKTEELQKTQSRLEKEIQHSADVTIKLNNLQTRVWNFVNKGWFTRLFIDVEEFFYGK